MSKKTGNGGSIKDFHLWKAFVKDIIPFKDPKWQEKEHLFEEDVKKIKEPPKSLVEIIDVVPVLSITPSLKPLQEYVNNDSFQLDRRTSERLRKGKLMIEATLDLHGYNQTQAKIALEIFIQNCFKQNKRCLLVITGKGRTGKISENWISSSEGVLKQKVPEWLKIAPLSGLVLQSCPARPSHGGEGACYVYLRKSR